MATAAASTRGCKLYSVNGATGEGKQQETGKRGMRQSHRGTAHLITGYRNSAACAFHSAVPLLGHSSEVTFPKWSRISP